MIKDIASKNFENRIYMHQIDLPMTSTLQAR